jgi:hypothetical protein
MMHAFVACLPSKDRCRMAGRVPKLPPRDGAYGRRGLRFNNRRGLFFESFRALPLRGPVFHIAPPLGRRPVRVRGLRFAS